ncbi:NEDD4 family-interacting protein 1 [Lingula anatina]|uniref:NEDD4 family-interacting protein 1 n=1 Tax=Lingula anatina TaxID=7574 RepID=A0A1S3ISI3_LINAN|nr:NEDD4 family-interacting protein 1 [Lingula anatina]|eukprot:XP_013401033.1 NEDD4 family-interacting protein 1 [Lingula anatina]
MESGARYQVLQEEEESSVPAQAVPLAMVVAPVPQPSVMEHSEVHTTPPPAYKESDFIPPPYDVATKLPSYEEAEISKQQMKHDEESNSYFDQVSSEQFDELTLGTDGIFMCTFLIAFLFNWFGLLFAMCASTTIAGRFGAFAGFGLSMVKWVAIVQHSHWISGSGYADADSWLWWLLMFLGFLIFFHGCVRYVSVKYKWQRLSSQSRSKFMFYM